MFTIAKQYTLQFFSFQIVLITTTKSISLIGSLFTFTTAELFNNNFGLFELCIKFSFGTLFANLFNRKSIAINVSIIFALLKF